MEWNSERTVHLASFPGPAQPSIFYHVSDVEGREDGREDLIEHRRIVDGPMPAVAYKSTVHEAAL